MNWLWCQYIYFPLKKKRYTISPEGTDEHIQQHHSSKIFEPLSDIILLCQGYSWIGKNKNKEFSCVMMFIMRPNSTLKFQFIFGFWAIFSLLNFENFWFYICVVVVRLLVLRHKWLQITTYLMLMNEKLESKDHQIYSKTLKKICKKSKSHKKTIFWSTFSIYMVQTFLKILWWQLLVPHSECFLISSATLSCKTWNVSTFSIVYYNTNTFFLRSFWLKHWSVQFINQGFKCFWA